MDNKARIEEILEQLDNLKEEMEMLKLQDKREIIDTFTFTDEQIEDGAWYLIKEKLEDDYADRYIIKDSIDTCWSLDQIEVYKGLGSNEYMREVFDKYFKAVKEYVEKFIENFEGKR